MGRYDILLSEDKKPEKHKSAEAAAPLPPVVIPSSPVRDGARGRKQQLRPHAVVSHIRANGHQATKRRFVRRTFDFFEDQIGYLTKVSLEERLAGKETSMNSMIREAIDDYMKKRTAQK